MALVVTCPLVMDLDGTVAASYRALVLPVHFRIDRDGVVRDWAFGELPPDVFTSILDAVLNPAQSPP
jgi:hypothetical protein